MKATRFPKALALLLLVMTASPVLASSAPEPIQINNEVRAVVLQNRLVEIEAIDKTSLSKSEKKALRREVKEIKKELAAVSGGIYLSIGAILLIALLLILLL